MLLYSVLLPVLRCSLIRPLISSSCWRSEVSRRGSKSPTLSCSLAMLVLATWGRGGDVAEADSVGEGRGSQRHSHSLLSCLAGSLIHPPIQPPRTTAQAEAE